MTTIQDLGRVGYQAFGIPVSGPMDHSAASLANVLVNNLPKEPVLEITLIGPEIEFNGSAVLAITGAPIDASLNGKKLDLNRTYLTEKRAVLSIGRVRQGCRTYLAIRGNWQIKKWLNSASWHQKNTTPDSWIQKGQQISIQTDQVNASEELLNSIPSGLEIPAMNVKRPISLLRGPEFDLLSQHQINQLRKQVFQIDPMSNRMGYRLNPALNMDQILPSIISSAVIPGTVQLTPSGQLIVLMADAQTTGGYPRIGVVKSEEMDRLGQLRPGDSFFWKIENLQ
ncbi:MAG: biotin-dependent carboxyltransferase family protein [Bacteroidota bacterium]